MFLCSKAGPESRMADSDRIASPSVDNADYRLEPSYVDPLASGYISFISLYSIFISVTILLMWKSRHEHAIRLRGFYLSALCVGSVHVYLAALFIVYPLHDAYTQVFKK